jgi:hypothetical protein
MLRLGSFAFACWPAIATSSMNTCEADRTSCNGDRAAVPRRSNGDGSRPLSLLSWAHLVELAVFYSPILQVSPSRQRGRARPRTTSGLACHSVGAGVRQGVRRVVRATEAVVINGAANEITPSNAKVLVVDACHATCAQANGMTSNATAAKATYVASTKAPNMATAEAAHVAAAAHAAPTVAAAATASGLRARCKKASGEQCARQHHYYSSFHDILHSDGRIFRRRT